MISLTHLANFVVRYTRAAELDCLIQSLLGSFTQPSRLWGRGTYRELQWPMQEDQKHIAGADVDVEVW